MGSNFFKARQQSHGPAIGNVQGSNLFARSISAPGYSARNFGGTAAKDMGMASAVYKAGGLKKGTRSAAYGPGPKRT